MARTVMYPRPKKGEHKSPANTGREYGILEAMASERHAQAEVRTAQYRVLTPQQRLARLDSRLGKGVGAKKERKRLQAFIEFGKSEERRHEAVKVRPSQTRKEA